MNIIKSRQLERLQKIKEITATYKQAEVEGKEIDKRLFTMSLCARWGISERTVKEYLKVAVSQL